MPTPQVDYEAVFQSLPIPVLLLTPDFVMVDANSAYERVSGHSRAELAGRGIFEVFPDNPAEPGVAATSNLSESLRRAAESGQPDMMALQRYDVEVPGKPGVFEERYWCPVNVPVLGPDGQVELLLYSAEEVSDLIRKYVEAEAANA